MFGRQESVVGTWTWELGTWELRIGKGLINFFSGYIYFYFFIFILENLFHFSKANKIANKQLLHIISLSLNLTHLTINSLNFFLNITLVVWLLTFSIILHFGNYRYKSLKLRAYLSNHEKRFFQPKNYKST